jgi:hypothetical protein
MAHDESQSWRVQIYQMTNREAQAAAAELLAGAKLIFDTRACESGAFLVVECAEHADALAVHHLLTLCDRNATLVHSAHGADTSSAGTNRSGRAPFMSPPA